MSYSALFLILGILSSLIFPDVNTAKLPLAGNNIKTITRRTFLKSNEDFPRSLEMEDSTLSMAPTNSGRVNSPSILRLYPILAKPAHTHTNLPLRFGRDSAHMHRTKDMHPKSSLNLPQRFGRSGNTEPIADLQCTMCRSTDHSPSATLPQRFGKRNLFLRDRFPAGAVLACMLDDRTTDQDYMIEMIEKEDKTIKKTKYTDLKF